MSTTALISSIMSSQISDSLSKVNLMMSEVEDSFSSVLSPTEFLPIIAELLEKMQNIVSLSKKSKVCDSIPDGDDMWWDQSDVCQQSVLSISTSSLDDILKHEELFPIVSSESESSSIHSLSSTSSNQAIFIDKLLTSISKVAPDCVFSRQKSKRRKSRKLRRLIHPELFTIWYYSSQLMSDVTKKPAQVSPYPEVDWTCVNKRFLTNVPNPVQYPVHGCSEDDDFYEIKYVKSDYGYMTNKGSAFNKDAPFGSLPGYRTIFGVVSVPTNQVFHGYSWLENEGWVLHATMPSAPTKARRIEKMKRGRKRR